MDNKCTEIQEQIESQNISEPTYEMRNGAPSCKKWTFQFNKAPPQMENKRTENQELIEKQNIPEPMFDKINTLEQKETKILTYYSYQKQSFNHYKQYQHKVFLKKSHF